MVKEGTVEFVAANRENLKLIARNGSKSAQKLAEAFLSAVPEEEGGTTCKTESSPKLQKGEGQEG